MTVNLAPDKADAVAVEVRIDRLSRLYNALDPAPFRERELEMAADDYIVGSAEEAGGRPIRLVVMLPASEMALPEASHIATSIRHHFELRRDSERRNLRKMWWRGRTSLAVGLAFLAACLLMRNLLADSPSAIFRILSEGLLIVGWVAMWGPLEIFLYGWWPIRARWKLMDQLSRADVELRSVT